MLKPTAVCLLRTNVHYRHEGFVKGLTVIGYEVRQVPLKRIGTDDILVVWNRGAQFTHEARRHEAAGSRVVVAENGYTDAVDGDGHQWFSLALDHHNGCGRWSIGDTPRFPRMGLDLKPWRAEGSFVLVLPQRGIGAPGVAMPYGWEADVLKRLARVSRRPVRVRAHPGLKSQAKPLEPALEGCHAVVTWGSGAGIKAIQLGVPCFHELQGWIGSPAARCGIADIENPYLGDRMPMFERLAWSQWTIGEIASGEAFRTLLEIG